VEDGSDYHVRIDGTRLPILASSRLRVDIYREQIIPGLQDRLHT